MVSLGFSFNLLSILGHNHVPITNDLQDHYWFKFAALLIGSTECYPTSPLEFSKLGQPQSAFTLAEVIFRLMTKHYDYCLSSPAY